MRSAAAPERIVTAVAQNIAWKKKKAVRHSPMDSKGRRNASVPIQPLRVAPNMRPKPRAQKRQKEIAKSVKFLSATLMLFFERVKPLSRHMKPPCIIKTSDAVTNIQRISDCSWDMLLLALDRKNHTRK